MKTIRHSLPMTICVAAMLTLPPCHAEQLPLWEAGAGVGALVLPDYRGADRSSTYILPIPYFIYRGDIVKADRNGVRTLLFDNGHIELNLSLSGTPPARSKNNPARRGMADLKPTVELGPTVSMNLWNSPTRDSKLDWRAPIRAAVTVESSPRHIGWLFAPSLNLDMKNPARLPGWNLGFATGLLFHDRAYNTHFYSVGPADANAARPVYQATAGYGGAQFTTTLSKRFPHYWVGGFLRYDTLRGAVFHDSPLVQESGMVSAGIAVSWVFGESARRVDARE